jgi:hypothetical protein
MILTDCERDVLETSRCDDDDSQDTGCSEKDVCKSVEPRGESARSASAASATARALDSLDL